MTYLPGLLKGPISSICLPALEWNYPSLSFMECLVKVRCWRVRKRCRGTESSDSTKANWSWLEVSTQRLAFSKRNATVSAMTWVLPFPHWCSETWGWQCNWAKKVLKRERRIWTVSSAVCLKLLIKQGYTFFPPKCYEVKAEKMF
jgi:hypothetical protein